MMQINRIVLAFMTRESFAIILGMTCDASRGEWGDEPSPFSREEIEAAVVDRRWIREEYESCDRDTSMLNREIIAKSMWLKSIAVCE